MKLVSLLLLLFQIAEPLNQAASPDVFSREALAIQVPFYRTTVSRERRFHFNKVIREFAKGEIYAAGIPWPWGGDAKPRRKNLNRIRRELIKHLQALRKMESEVINILGRAVDMASEENIALRIQTVRSSARPLKQLHDRIQSIIFHIQELPFYAGLTDLPERLEMQLFLRTIAHRWNADKVFLTLNIRSPYNLLDNVFFAYSWGFTDQEFRVMARAFRAIDMYVTYQFSKSQVSWALSQGKGALESINIQSLVYAKVSLPPNDEDDVRIWMGRSERSVSRRGSFLKVHAEQLRAYLSQEIANETSFLPEISRLLTEQGYKRLEKFMWMLRHNGPVKLWSNPDDPLLTRLIKPIQTMEKFGGGDMELLVYTWMGILKPLERRMEDVFIQILRNWGKQSTMDISPLIRKQVLGFEARAVEDGLVLTYETDGERERFARVDPSLLKILIDNLVENALKYTQRGGNVAVSLVSDEIKKAGLPATPGFLFQVKDTGIGIPQEDFLDLFEPGKRGTNVDAQVRGMGMGLSIVENIVLEMGGVRDFKSKENEGSTFTVFIPEHLPGSGDSTRPSESFFSRLFKKSS